jgi:predicted aldo/keto reductase-like oxidoreductase
MLHGVDESSWENTKRLDILRLLEQKKAEGFIRHIAFSSHEKPEIGLSFTKSLNQLLIRSKRAVLLLHAAGTTINHSKLGLSLYIMKYDQCCRTALRNNSGACM